MTTFPPTGIATSGLLALNSPDYLKPTKLPWLIWELIDTCWPNDTITYTDTHPKKPVDSPTVVWSIYHRVPGKTGIETKGPRYRGNEERENAVLEHYGQKQTVTYQFDIYDRTNATANQLMERFEEYMYTITPVLYDVGVEKMYFLEQINDHQLAATEQMSVRSLRYTAIMDKRYAREIPLINIIRMQIRHDVAEALFESVVRSSTQDYDELDYANVLYIQSITNDADLRNADYGEGSDYEVLEQPLTKKCAVRWLGSGKNPAAGSTYYVTYLYYSKTTVDDVV